ncbi:MAG: multidrug transporter subunit MdtA, partial [Pseudomonadota bacterium]
GRRRQANGAASPSAASPSAASPSAASPGSVAPARADIAQPRSSGDGQGLASEERQKRWAEINARIDRGEFGEEIRKLPEEGRRQRMRELRAQRNAGKSADRPQADGSRSQQ